MSSGQIVQIIGAVIDVEFPRENVPKVYDALKVTSTGLTLGAAATAPLVVWLMELYGWRASFYLTAPAAFVLAAVWWWYVRDYPRDHARVSPGELALENHDFISLWDTYNQCVAGSNIHEMHVNLKLLHMAPRPISIDDSPIPLPKFLKKLTSSRNSGTFSSAT